MRTEPEALDRSNGGWQRIAELERELADRDARLERMTDLVRYQRHALHETELITDEEYAALVQRGGAVQRLEGYDAIRKQLAEAQQARERAESLASAAIQGKSVAERHVVKVCAERDTLRGLLREVCTPIPFRERPFITISGELCRRIIAALEAE